MRTTGNRPWAQELVRAQHTFPHTVSNCKASPLWLKLLSEGTRPHTSVYLRGLCWCHWNCWCSPTPIHELPSISQPLLLGGPVTWLSLANGRWALGRCFPSRTSTRKTRRSSIPLFPCCSDQRQMQGCWIAEFPWDKNYHQLSMDLIWARNKLVFVTGLIYCHSMAQPSLITTIGQRLLDQLKQ